MRVIVAVVVALLMAASSVSAERTSEASPVATPVASPTVTNGCDALPAYFQTLATTSRENDGYVTVRSNPNGVFALPADQVELVASSLENLIRELDAIDPPDPAVAYHAAYIQLVVWYKDLAEALDVVSHQRIINRDKQLFPNISRATYAGQAICGTDVWTTAWNAAFTPQG